MLIGDSQPSGSKIFAMSLKTCRFVSAFAGIASLICFYFEMKYVKLRIQHDPQCFDGVCVSEEFEVFVRLSIFWR